MSATETPSAAQAPTPEPRRCPHCGAHLSPEQEWCLDCGAAVGTTIARPSGWRLPFAVVGGLALIALIAVVLALVELAGPAEEVKPVAATPTAVAPGPAVATPTASAQPTPTTTAPPATAKLATWPKGKTAWTVILNSSGTREDANRLGASLAAKGVQGVGVLDSNRFRSLGPDSFVVFSGQYPNRSLAEEALATFRDRTGGGSTRKIVPK